MAKENKEILNQLKEIRIDINFIKESMPDKEMFLTTEEERLLEESYINEKNSELTSNENLRKELEI